MLLGVDSQGGRGHVEVTEGGTSKAAGGRLGNRKTDRQDPDPWTDRQVKKTDRLRGRQRERQTDKQTSPHQRWGQYE